MTTPAAAIYFWDNPSAFKRLQIRDIAPETRMAVQRLYRMDDRHNLRLLLFPALWAIGSYGILYASTPTIRIAACLAIVCAFIGFSVVVHETSHQRMFRNAIVNDLVGVLCGLAVILPVYAFRAYHSAHHVRRNSVPHTTGNGFDLSRVSSLAVFALGNLAKSFAFVTVLPVVAIANAGWGMRLRIFSEYGFIAAFAAFVLQAVPFELVWQMWLLPLLIAALLTQLRAVAEHGLTTKGNVFTATRTVVSNRHVSYLMCNINFHLEHHLFPGVPWYNLPKAHQLLRDEYRRAGASVYRSYTCFFVDFFKATWSGIVPDARLIPVEARQIPRG
jgi:fatty acid desaturase